jgi:hypothetical protein
LCEHNLSILSHTITFLTGRFLFPEEAKGILNIHDLS